MSSLQARSLKMKASELNMYYSESIYFIQSCCIVKKKEDKCSDDKFLGAAIKRFHIMISENHKNITCLVKHRRVVFKSAKVEMLATRKHGHYIINVNH